MKVFTLDDGRTPAQWRKTIEAGPFEVLDWKEDHSPLAETLLAEHPEVEETLLSGINRPDLVCSQIKVWLRNKGNGGGR